MQYDNKYTMTISDLVETMWITRYLDQRKSRMINDKNGLVTSSGKTLLKNKMGLNPIQ